MTVPRPGFTQTSSSAGGWSCISSGTQWDPIVSRPFMRSFRLSQKDRRLFPVPNLGPRPSEVRPTKRRRSTSKEIDILPLFTPRCQGIDCTNFGLHKPSVLKSLKIPHYNIYGMKYFVGVGPFPSSDICSRTTEDVT